MQMPCGGKLGLLLWSVCRVRLCLQSSSSAAAMSESSYLQNGQHPHMSALQL